MNTFSIQALQDPPVGEGLSIYRFRIRSILSSSPSVSRVTVGGELLNCLAGDREGRAGCLRVDSLPASISPETRKGESSMSTAAMGDDKHLFVIWAPDYTDEEALARRLKARSAHVEQWKGLKESGIQSM